MKLEILSWQNLHELEKQLYVLFSTLLKNVFQPYILNLVQIINLTYPRKNVVEIGSITLLIRFLLLVKLFC